MVNIQLTQELIKSLFDYKDGFLYWKVKRCNIHIGDLAGNVDTHKTSLRRRIKINNKTYIASRLIFLWHNGWMPEIVDHRDLDDSNNNIDNLRAADKAKNNKNRRSAKNSTSKYLGVHLQEGRWIAQIQTGGRKQKYLGIFKLEEDAAMAYNEAAKIQHKEFANLNIIVSPS